MPNINSSIIDLNDFIDEPQLLRDIQSGKAISFYTFAHLLLNADGTPYTMPKGVQLSGNYDTLNALKAAFPKGNSNLYIVNEDSKIYYWNGADWVVGGGINVTYASTLELDSPPESTSGTLTSTQLNTLKSNTFTQIKLGNFIYRKEAVISTKAIYRCITDDFLYVLSVDTSTGSWVKTSQELPEQMWTVNDIPNGGIVTNMLQDDSVTPQKTTFMNSKISILNFDDVLLDKTPNWIGWMDDITANEQLTDSQGYMLTPAFACKPGDTFIWNFGHYANNVWMAGENKVVSNIKEISEGTPYTIPDGIYRIRFAFAINNDPEWRTKIILKNEENLDNALLQGQNEVLGLKLNLDIPAPIFNKDEVYCRNEPIVILNFDGWDQNTFNIMYPYLKEKRLPFTLFGSYNLDSNILFNAFQEYGDNIERGPYVLQDLVWKIDNKQDTFTELKEDIKTNIRNTDVATPVKSYACSLSGGRTNDRIPIAVTSCGLRMARLTDNAHIDLDTLHTSPLISAFSFAEGNDWMFTTIDNTIAKNKSTCVLTHNIGDDNTYQMTEAGMKRWIDYIADKRDAGQLKVMNFQQYFKYALCPHSAKQGDVCNIIHCGSNIQFVFDGTKWIEV